MSYCLILQIILKGKIIKSSPDLSKSDFGNSAHAQSLSRIKY